MSAGPIVAACTVWWNLSNGEVATFTWTEMFLYLVIGFPCLSVLCFLSDKTNGPGRKILVALPTLSAWAGLGKKSKILGK